MQEYSQSSYTFAMNFEAVGGDESRIEHQLSMEVAKIRGALPLMKDMLLDFETVRYITAFQKAGVQGWCSVKG